MGSAGETGCPRTLPPCRNPMITSVLLMLGAESFLLGSWHLAGWMSVFFLLNLLYFLWVEEPRLELSGSLRRRQLSALQGHTCRVGSPGCDRDGPPQVTCLPRRSGLSVSARIVHPQESACASATRPRCQALWETISSHRRPAARNGFSCSAPESFLLGSWHLAGWMSVFFLLKGASGSAGRYELMRNQDFLWVEEPRLEQRFGDSYRRYKANVPGWIPRLRPWDPHR